MRKFFTQIAKYWKAWNEIYLGQVHHEDEPFPVEQIGLDWSSAVVRSHSCETQSAEPAIERALQKAI
jgi:hypothetical protein